MAYQDFKDLAKRTASDKVLRDEAFNIAKILNMTDIKEGWLLWFKNYLIKSSGSGVANNEIKQNLQLAEESHKPIIRNFKKSTVYSEFKDNIWDADLAV